MDFKLNPPESHPALRAQLRKDLAELDYLREIQKLLNTGTDPKQVTHWLSLHPKIAQSTIEAARNVTPLLEGFSGAVPIEICERYAANLISREQLITELINYPYVPIEKPEGLDDLIVDPTGTWSEVSLAYHISLIDEDVYEEVSDRCETGG